MTPPECYVCTESDPRPQKSACQCTDRYIHDACLAKMLETTRHARCPVCAAPFANISSRIAVVGVAPCARGGMVIGAAIAATVLLGCAINTWNAYERANLSGKEDFVVCFAAILMTIMGVTCLAFVGRECVMVGPRDLARSTLVRKRKVCVLPSEILVA
jgi:hypothetical protein